MAGKRNNEDSSNATNPQQPRWKRTRYTSTACDECKRRKVKCDGGDPCQRCESLSLRCAHVPNCCSNSIRDSEDFKDLCQQVVAMQEKIAELSNTVAIVLNGLEIPTIPSLQNNDESEQSVSQVTSALLARPTPSAIPERHKSVNQVFGPSSSTYWMDFAKSSLQNQGIINDTSNEDLTTRERQDSIVSRPAKASADPLLHVQHAEVMRLCYVFEEDVGTLYPIVDIEKILEYVDSLYGFTNAAIRSGLAEPRCVGVEFLVNVDATILKVLLAISLTVEAGGHSDQGWQFFESAKPFVDSLLAKTVNVKSIMLVVLVATFYYHQGDEVQAWRWVGIASRMSLEHGLHRKSLVDRVFVTETDRVQATRLFWIVYSLDRRWSFGTGMPFAIRESDIDPTLPEVEDNYAYLKYIVRFNRLATKVWSCNRGYLQGKQPQKDEIDLLNYQIQEWYRSLPDDLQFDHHNLHAESQIPRRAMRRIRLIMYLRKHQLMISAYRPVLQSAASIDENADLAKDVVSVAKEIINTLTGINKISDIYRNQQVTFNAYLMHALAVLFLSVAHAPAIFYHSTKKEYYTAIKLIKENGTKSYVSKCLWRSIRGLKDIGDKIALLASDEQQHNPNAIQQTTQTHQHPHQQFPLTMGMIELDDHGFDYSVFDNSSLNFFEHQDQDPGYALQMSNGLSSLFELAGNYGNLDDVSTANQQHNVNPNNDTDFLAHNTSSNEVGTDFSLSLMSNKTEFARLVNGLF